VMRQCRTLKARLAANEADRVRKQRKAAETGAETKAAETGAETKAAETGAAAEEG
jgi:hypothetical protein